MIIPNDGTKLSSFFEDDFEALEKKEKKVPNRRLK
jgi:hypothetical protein